MTWEMIFGVGFPVLLAVLMVWVDWKHPAVADRIRRWF